MGNRLPSQVHVLFDILFPPVCAVCRIDTSHRTKFRLICPSCFVALAPTKEFRCAACEAKTIEGKTCLRCADTCPLDRFFFLHSYTKPQVRIALSGFKYQFVRDLGGVFGRIMDQYLAETGLIQCLQSIDAIVPVPLTRLRLNWRGFNQAEVLAHELAGRIQKPVFSCLIRRGLLMRPQAKIKDVHVRMKNVNDVFVCHDAEVVKNKTLLLVDDVYTSGATMQACARVLKATYAKQVWGFAVARG